MAFLQNTPREPDWKVRTCRKETSMFPISTLSLEALIQINHEKTTLGATMQVSVPDNLFQNKERIDSLKYLLQEYGFSYSYEQIIWDSRWILWNRLDKPRGVPWYGGLSPGPPSPMAAIYIFEPIHVRNYVLFQDNVPPSAFGRNVMASSTVTPPSQSKAPTSQPTGSTPKATTSTAQSHHSRLSSESGTGSSALSHGSSLPGDIPQYTLRNSNEHQPQATTYARAPAPQAVHHHPPPLPTIMYPPGTIYGYLQPTNPEQSSQVPPPNPQSLPSQTAPSTGETANLGQERVDSDFAEEEEARKRFRELPTQEGSSITDSRTPRNDMKELKERLSEEKGETMKLPDGPSGDQDQKE